MSSDPVASFETGNVVQVVGLKSKAGKKLNGSYGLIYSKTKKQFPPNVERYPVVLYAGQVCDTEARGNGPKEDFEYEILENNTIKSIKAENLKPVLNFHSDDLARDLYAEAFNVYVKETVQTQKDKDVSFFWLESHYTLFPDDFRMAGSYARWLRDVKNRYKEAWKVMKPLNKNFDPEDKEFYPIMCSDYCITAAKAQQDLQVALEYAQKVPEEHVELAAQSYLTLMTSAEQQIQASMNPQTLDTTQLAAIHNACAKALYDLGPPDAARNLANLGASYCLAGNSLEGAKMYRKAIAIHRQSSRRGIEYCLDEPDKTKCSLILAQLQCPGMPLEDYFVTSFVGDGDNPGVHCIHNRDRANCQVKMTKLPQGGVHGMMRANTGATVDALFKPIPTDPDDPAFFSAEFLQKLT